MVTDSVRQAPSVQDQPCSLTPFIPRCSARGRAARGRCHDLGWALGSQLKQRTGGEGEEGAAVASEAVMEKEETHAEDCRVPRSFEED